MPVYLKFRPQTMSRKYRRSFSNFQPRRINHKLNGPINQQVISRIFGVVHYLTCHSPDKVRSTHEQLKSRWNKKLRNGRANIHTWL